MAAIFGAENTISVKNQPWLFLLLRHSFVTRPDPISFFFKLQKGCPTSSEKFQHDVQRFDCHLHFKKKKTTGEGVVSLLHWRLLYADNSLRRLLFRVVVYWATGYMLNAKVRLCVVSDLLAAVAGPSGFPSQEHSDSATPGGSMLHASLPADRSPRPPCSVRLPPG